MRGLGILIRLALAATATLAPAFAGEVLVTGESDRVAAVVDGDTVILDSGASVRLVGIQAPKLALGRAGFKPWPLGPQAKAALEALASERIVTLAYGGRRRDRHGRRLAHLIRDDGLWVQGALLERGMARVYSFADNRARIADMLAREDQARRAGRGIWAHPFYWIRDAGDLRGANDSFQLVEGRVVDAAIVRGRAYLNFGPDWRTDFTVTVAGRDRDRFDAAHIDLAALAGHRVRVRGWLKRYNGPMIELDHPEQLELLD
jgi:endonuclease YncB( thermonuclease family)